MSILHRSINAADPAAPTVAQCVAAYAKWAAAVATLFSVLTVLGTVAL